MSLKSELNLVSLTPMERAYKNPTEYSLRQVPKIQQTAELVEYVVSIDGNALKSVSKKLITDELCKIAVQQNGVAINYVPVQFITDEICNLAVSDNGLALMGVPLKYITLELAEKAISYYHTAINSGISSERKNIIIETSKTKGRKLPDYIKYPIAYVPASLVSEKLLNKAVMYSPYSLRDIPTKLIKKEIAFAAISVDGLALQYVPRNLISKAMIEVAISNQPLALQFIPPKKITEEVCLRCFESNALAIQYIPSEYLSLELCESAFRRDPNTFKGIPNEYKTSDMCVKAVRQDNFGFSTLKEYKTTILFDDLPEDKRNDKSILEEIIEKYENGAKMLLRWNEQIIRKSEYADVVNPLYDDTIKYLEKRVEILETELRAKSSPSKAELKIIELQRIDSSSMSVQLEPLPINALSVKYENDMNVVHNLADKYISAQTIYYVTDIHLEHQLMPLIEKYGLEKKGAFNGDLQSLFWEADEFLDQKIQELISGAKDRESLLLIGGDVANSKELSFMFYKKLSSYWKGRILFILGNHELWDGYLETQITNTRTVDDIVNDYRETVNNRELSWNERLTNVDLLENDIYIIYKNQSFGQRIICEEQILKASNEELADICCAASVIILGGIGFSGLNPHFNAELGLYRSTVTSLAQDKRFTKRFWKIYEKLAQCASDKQVIVFTHTPIYDWSNEPCNSNWIYINGHTHQNSLIREENGAVILSDNQIGYEPQKWKLNAVSIRGWYDPFEKYEDGIYEITSELYMDFNVGRGIDCRGCNYQGRIYALKHDGLYMFLMETNTSLCLLNGGSRKKLEYLDIGYYYDNMNLYGRTVKKATQPYQQLLETISLEVKSFGGTGKIHGCIVDISGLSHIYVNPFDGKITSYWALDISSRIAYDNIKTLLEEKEPSLFNRFLIEYNQKMLPIIDKHMTGKSNSNANALVPQWVIGTEMYGPSRVFKAVQYIWSHNVIRIWNEDVLISQGNESTIEEKNMLIE